jgi:predicted amidohydrolase YtcJ
MPTMLMREAHCHIGLLGAAMALPTVTRCASVGEVLAMVGELARKAKPGQWVRVLGARHQGWRERRWPTVGELDAATAGVPTVVMSMDWHECVANTPAMTLAGLAPGARVGANGVVHVDANGLATGLLIEHAAYAAWESAPAAPAGALPGFVRAGLARYQELGFAEVHDLRTEPALAKALLEMDASGELARLGVRVAMFPLVRDLPELVEMVAQAGGSGRLRVGGGKIFIDGTLNARTAATLQPCAEPIAGCTLGKMMVGPEEIDAQMRACDAFGLPMAAHAIGDRAVRAVLDSFARVRPATPGTRIEHCELIDPADVPRFAELGVTASVQPCHLLVDMPVLTRVYGHALHKVLPLRSLLASGLRAGSLVGGLVFGSDAPIVGPEPADSVLAAMTLGDGFASLNPGEAIDDATAWKCFAVG